MASFRLIERIILSYWNLSLLCSHFGGFEPHIVLKYFLATFDGEYDKCVNSDEVKAWKPLWCCDLNLAFYITTKLFTHQNQLSFGDKQVFILDLVNIFDKHFECILAYLQYLCNVRFFFKYTALSNSVLSSDVVFPRKWRASSFHLSNKVERECSFHVSEWKVSHHFFSFVFTSLCFLFCFWFFLFHVEIIR